MEPTSREPLRGADPSVHAALRAAGWAEGRRFDATVWVERLESAGFELNDLALRVWAEFGGLRIASSEARVPPSSLRIDPVDACIDCLDEARALGRRFGENYSPLGMWSSQFRAYLAASGRVVAVGPRTMWDLGSSFAEALDYVVNGDDGPSRAQDTGWSL